MTWRRLYPAVSATLVLFAILATRVAPGTPRAQRVALDLQAALVAPPPDSRPVLPDGFFAAVDVATSQRFVRIVTGDIDRDGDIDVVASVGTLDLLVWANDGQGHFARVPSSPHEALRAQPLAPAFDEGALGVNEWIQNDHERGDHRTAFLGLADDNPDIALSARARVVPGRRSRRLRSPRAPPLALAL